MGKSNFKKSTYIIFFRLFVKIKIKNADIEWKYCLELLRGISLYMMISVDSSMNEEEIENKGGNRWNFFNLKIKKNWRSIFYSSTKEEENGFFFKI